MCGLRASSKLAPRSLDKQQPCLPVHTACVLLPGREIPGAVGAWGAGRQACRRHQPAGLQERGTGGPGDDGLPPSGQALRAEAGRSD